MGSCKMNRSLYPPTTILKVYIEVLTGFSPMYCPDCHKNTLFSKGYILKEADMDSIIDGIKKVLSGETYVDSRISSKVIASLISPEEDLEQPEDSTYDTLSSREQEILRLLAEGREIRDIAKELCISSKTVINHRTNIMQKLNCSNMVARPPSWAAGAASPGG